MDSSVRRDIDDDRGGVVLTIKNKKYNNQQAGLLASALGGLTVGVRSIGGGFARVWRAVVFVGWATTGGSLVGRAVATHRDGEVGNLRDAGRDGRIRGSGG